MFSWWWTLGTRLLGAALVVALLVGVAQYLRVQQRGGGGSVSQIKRTIV